MIATLLLVGCVAHDGTWLVTLTLSSSTDEDDTIGASQDNVTRLSTLGDGGAALDFGGLVLVGEITGADFSFSYSQGASYTDPECALFNQTNSATVKGTFTADGGLEGTATSSTTYASDACDAFDPEDYPTQTMTFDVVGLRLNADGQDHPTDGMSWGYVFGGMYW